MVPGVAPQNWLVKPKIPPLYDLQREFWECKKDHLVHATLISLGKVERFQCLCEPRSSDKKNDQYGKLIVQSMKHSQELIYLQNIILYS
jgi:hypothetical protein